MEQQIDKVTQQEISNALVRYNLTVEILVELLDKIEAKNIGNPNWYTYSEKIGRKFLTEAITLQQIFAENLYLVKGGRQQRIIPLSSIFSQIRVLLETYAVFYHLFADTCSIEERIIRFRLWQLDGLRTRQKYSILENNREIVLQLTKESEEIDQCIDVINKFTYFKNLDEANQKYLINNAVWRFNDDLLRQANKRKNGLSINQMIMNTGLKDSFFQDWYTYTSTHTHTTFLSVIQIDTITDDDNSLSEYIAMVQAAFITSFLIKDFNKLYEVAKTFFNSLPTTQQAIINQGDSVGRNHRPN